VRDLKLLLAVGTEKSGDLGTEFTTSGEVILHPVDDHQRLFVTRSDGGVGGHVRLVVVVVGL
jgi:hypothetical protein